MFKRYRNLSPNPEPGAGSGGVSNPTPGAAGAADKVFIAGKQYTQEEANAIIGGRVKEAKSTAATEAVATLLKELGVEKPEDAVTILTKARELEDSQKTAQQKLADSNAALQKKLDAAGEREKTIQAQATEKMLHAVVLTELNKAGFDPSENAAAWQLIKGDAELRALIKPKGDDDFEGVDEAVKKFDEAHPRWPKAEQQPEGDGIGTPRRPRGEVKLKGDTKPKVEQKLRATGAYRS